MKIMLWILLGIIVITPMALSYAGVCGDVNADRTTSVSDAIFLINHLFKGGPAPNPMASGDVNNDGKVNVGDVVYLISYLFKGGPEPTCPAFYTLAPATSVIPPESSTVILRQDTSTVVISSSSPYAQKNVGDIICGRDSTTAPDGFLRKITSKTLVGDSTIFGTTQASLPEAFQLLYVNEVIDLNPSEVKSYKMLPGATFAPGKSGPAFTITLNCVFFDQDHNPATTDDQIKLTGQYTFNPQLFINVETSWLTLKKFEAGIISSQNATITLSSNLQWTLDTVITVGTWNLAPLPIPSTPLWVTPNLTLKAYVHGDLTVTFVTGISYTLQTKYGFGYANNAYYNISESSKQFTYNPPQLNAQFNFEPGLELDAALLLCGVVGPYFGGKAGLHFLSTLSADMCKADLSFSLDALFYAVVGGKCDLIIKTFDYNSAFQIYSYPIGNWKYQLGGTIVINPDPNSINAPWTLTGPCTYGGNGDLTIPNAYPGSYKLTWGTVSGWALPNPSISTQSLTIGQTITFNGTYVQLGPPVVTTASVTGITTTTAQCGGNVTSDGGFTVTARGVCWSTSPTPTIANSKTTDGSGTGVFTSSIIGLTPNTLYYVRAYATNSQGTGYGSARSFTTPPVVSPTVTTTSVSSIGGTTAQSGGNVTADGGATVTARGVCWSTNPTPTTADSKTTDGSGTGSFTSSITGLSPNTTYYVRAYAINSAGTGYGSALQFTTHPVPVVTTTAVTNITQTTAQSGGNVTSDGGSAVTARGVCWSTNPTPTITDSKTTDGSGLGSYTSSITGLSANTSYYVRAYATNSAGTGYGSALQFTTLPPPSLPVVTTTSISNITSTSAQSGGNVTSDGGNPVTSKGVCWSTSPSPSIANSKTVDGSGLGSYISSIMALLPNTTYHVRAYAINSVGPGYGSDMQFTTSDTSNTVRDIDGNVYRTVTIGTQVWMAENLRVTHYRNGDAIPHVTDSATWVSNYGPGSYGAYCEYNNDTSYVATYGRLYNYQAGTDSRGLAPAGWHVPTDADFRTLMANVGGDATGGGHLKEAGFIHWMSPNTGADDSYQFTALPGGVRANHDGLPQSNWMGMHGLFWTTYMQTCCVAEAFGMDYNDAFLGMWLVGENWGLSIRCVKD